ncbi:hypothetical protein ACUUL3_07875 [Thiovibrio sp. JS02]
MKLSSMVKTKTRTQAKAHSAVDTQVARNFLGTVGVASAVIGLWSVACLVSAMVSNGPLALVQGWFQAVGML